MVRTVPQEGCLGSSRAIPLQLAATGALPIVFAEFLTHHLADERFLLDLRS